MSSVPQTVPVGQPTSQVPPQQVESWAIPGPPPPQSPPESSPQPPQQYPPPYQWPPPPAGMFYQQPPQPQQPDPAQQATLAVLQEITKSLQDIKKELAAPPPDPDVQVRSVREKSGGTREFSMGPREAPEPREEQVSEEDRALAVPEDTGLKFLTVRPSPPTMQVVFDLGAGGQHLKRFHYVTSRGKCLSMLYDTRWEGDQFTPPCTREGDDPIKITFPQYKNKVVRALVPQDFNQRLGCLDQLNFIIVDDDSTSEQLPQGDLAAGLGH